MNSPHPLRTASLMRQLDQIDTAVRGQQIAPPRHTDNHRSAIHSCVNALVTNITEKTKALREALDQIDRLVIQSAERSRHALEEHLAICDKVDDEIAHARGVVADLAEQARDA